LLSEEREGKGFWESVIVGEVTRAPVMVKVGSMTNQGGS